ncbi:MAG: metallophosphoesterase [Verrucomicrobiales bacterium]|nr:metallophosphoesterase [Verrucomicrobiales bacterium]
MSEPLRTIKPKSQASSACIPAMVLALSLCHFSISSVAQNGTNVIDARTSIFGAGNAGISSDGSGLAPIAFALNPGSERTLSFLSVTGSVGAVGQQGFDADGGNFANIPVNIDSFGGISGIVDNTFDHNLALMGVFTTGTPTGAAPARLDITASHSVSSTAPLLNQSFFIGDGRTGRASGGFQTFAVPKGATALQLGFVDADSLLGPPKSYGNNAGSLTAVFNVSPRNLLTNGNFELGYTIFSTDYVFNPPGNDSTPGTYAVLTNAHAFNSVMPVTADHTSSNGLMLLIDGSLAANKLAWAQTVLVLTNASYQFSGWASSSIDIAPGTLRFSINGVQVGADFALPANAGVWTQFVANWSSGTNTVASIKIVDLSTVNHGNDFALDDLFFGDASAQPAIPVPITLVAPGSVWKYLDDGSEPGAAWRTTNFNENSWSAGAAQLGYGDGDEATLVRSNRLDNTRIITTYFRKSFNVGSAWSLDDVILRLLRDDGGIVYLNGIEVFRSNMPNGPVSSTTPALTAITGADESIFVATNLNSGLLLNGANLLAVEIHQSSVTSSDLSFDLVLSGVSFGRPALSIQRDGANYLLSWPISPPGFRLESASNLLAGGSWVVDTNSTATVTNGLKSIRQPVQAGSRFFRLAKP